MNIDMRLRLTTHKIVLLSACILGIIVAMLIFSTVMAQSPKPTFSFGYSFPKPADAREMVKQSQVIIVAKVGPVVNQGTFAGYDQNGNLITPTDSYTQGPATSFVDYQLIVEQTLKDGRSQSNVPLILRMPANRTSDIQPNDEYPMSASGDRHLFFLTQNADQKTYGLYYGSWSRINIEQVQATASNGPRTPIKFNGRTFTPKELIAEVVKAVQSAN